MNCTDCFNRITRFATTQQGTTETKITQINSKNSQYLDKIISKKRLRLNKKSLAKIKTYRRVCVTLTFG